MARLVILLWLTCLPATLFAQQQQYDLIIRNGRIIDGTGSPWYSGDVAIRAGQIAAVGALVDAKAEQTIDAAGMVVAPGFIDMLGQSDLSILVDSRLPSKIFQGITTEITGEGNWGRMSGIVAKIESARRTGINIAADTYAYTAWFNSLSAMVPP